MSTRTTLAATILILLYAGCAPSIHDLAIQGDLDGVRERIESDRAQLTAFNRLNKSPLHAAASEGPVEMVTLLLELGAPINAPDKTGLTPLHVAAMVDRPEIVALLLENHAALEAQDTFGDTPLHTAAMHGAEASVHVLLAAGANRNALNKQGLTPAALAKKHRRKRLAKSLEDHNDSN